MEKTFKPKKAVNETAEIKKIFLSGKSIKIDGRGLVEVTEDKYNNVKCPSGFSEQCFFDAVNELKQEGYIVQRTGCQGSGCCQYHAVSYWLVGE